MFGETWARSSPKGGPNGLMLAPAGQLPVVNFASLAICRAMWHGFRYRAWATVSAILCMPPMSGRLGSYFMTRQLGEDETECRLLTDVDHRRFIPLGWRLRPDVAQREQHTGLRDGDVLVPVPHSIHPSIHTSGSARLLPAILPFTRWLSPGCVSALLCLAVCQISSAMVAPTPEQQTIKPTPVGKYPWRDPI